jgi:DNA (cytosine-5)-methyltransferase 1
LCRRLEPRAVFVENPPAILTLDGGRPFGAILGTLAALGFDARWTCLRASDVGAPHRRDRLFLLAWRAALADAGCISSERWGGRRGVGGETRTGEGEGAERERVRHAVGDGCEDLADADRGRFAGQRLGGLLDGERAPLGHDVDGCGGAWTEGGGQAFGGLGRMLDGPPGGLDEHRWPAPPGEEQAVWEPRRTTTAPTKDRRSRLKALGNAVVRQQAAEAWRRLVGGEAGSVGR